MARRRTFPTLAAMAATSLYLAACATPPAGEAPEDGTPAETVAAPPAPTEPAPEPEPAVPPPALSTLFGTTPAQVLRMLGAPALKRLDPPAELWQYRADGCVLALYLYTDPKAAPATVTHVEAREPKTAARVETEACFHAVLRERKKGAADGA